MYVLCKKFISRYGLNYMTYSHDTLYCMKIYNTSEIPIKMDVNYAELDGVVQRK